MILVADPFGSIFPPIFMDWWVPAIVVAGLFVYILYKFLQKFNLIDW